MGEGIRGRAEMAIADVSRGAEPYKHGRRRDYRVVARSFHYTHAN